MLNQHVLSLWDVKGSNNEYSNKHKDCNVQEPKILMFTTEMKKETSHQSVKKKID
jgi:hypothetical protein